MFSLIVSPPQERADEEQGTENNLKKWMKNKQADI